VKKEEVEITRITHYDSIRGLDIKLHNGQILQVEFPVINFRIKKGMKLEGYLIGIGEVEKIENVEPEIIISEEPLNQLLDIIGYAKNLSKRTIEINSIINLTMEHKNMKQIASDQEINEGDLIHLSYPIIPSFLLNEEIY
jgi:hypothetical protein